MFQYLYLRAKDDRERQQWLISLGSAKACVSKTNTHGRSRLSSASPIPVPPTSCTQAPSHLQPSSKVSDSDREITTNKTSTELIRAKRLELRLYCDLLMQQVHTIKTAVKDSSNEVTGVDMEKLNEGCSLLTQTCDTFIHTLDETMKLANHASFIPSHDREANIHSNAPTTTVIQQTNLAQNGEKVDNSVSIIIYTLKCCASINQYGQYTLESASQYHIVIMFFCVSEEVWENHFV